MKRLRWIAPAGLSVAGLAVIRAIRRRRAAAQAQEESNQRIVREIVENRDIFPVIDPVEQASLDSFPASDPPGW